MFNPVWGRPPPTNLGICRPLHSACPIPPIITSLLQGMLHQLLRKSTHAWTTNHGDIHWQRPWIFRFISIPFLSLFSRFPMSSFNNSNKIERFEHEKKVEILTPSLILTFRQVSSLTSQSFFHWILMDSSVDCRKQLSLSRTCHWTRLPTRCRYTSTRPAFYVTLLSLSLCVSQEISAHEHAKQSSSKYSLFRVSIHYHHMALISCCYGTHSGALVLHLTGHCLFQAESHPNVDIGPDMNRVSLTPTHPCLSAFRRLIFVNLMPPSRKATWRLWNWLVQDPECK